MSIPKTQHQNMQGGGGVAVARVKVKKTLWHQKKRRSFVQRDSISGEEWEPFGGLLVGAVGCGDSGHYKGERFRDTDGSMIVFL